MPDTATRSVVRRVAHILGALAERSPLSVAELARITALPYATCHRLVAAMTDARLITRDAATRRVFRRDAASEQHER
jgi:DNA-binding IclR family transcriptional regulator